MTAEASLLPPRPWHLIVGPLLALALALVLVGPVESVALALGFLGWLAAIILRVPLARGLALAGARRPTVEGGMLVASGPVEEITRWGCLLLVGAGMETAIWLGLGWALSEAVFSCLSVLVVRRTLLAGGEQADILRAQLEEAGPQGGSCLMAGLERASATLAHVGFSLMVSSGTAGLLIAMVSHSLFNLSAHLTMKRTGSAAMTEGVIACFGGAILISGFLLQAG